jgi:AcrR family transcriptional regulator
MAEPLRRGDPERKTRPGGRSAAVNRAVLEATLAELVERGYGEMTFESIAARAGVHRSTLYRRWAGKAEVAADALLAHSAVAVPIPDTGSTLDDLEGLAMSIARNIGSPFGEGLVRALVSDASRVPAVVAAAQTFWTERFALVREVVRRGITRGDLPADLDADAFIESLVSPLFFRLLVTGRALDAGEAVTAARRTTRAAQLGLLSETHPDTPVGAE